MERVFEILRLIGTGRRVHEGTGTVLYNVVVCVQIGFLDRDLDAECWRAVEILRHHEEAFVSCLQYIKVSSFRRK
jgi:hypothetical protein